MATADDKDEFLFKILVIGDIATGKTSIIKRYVHGIFSDHYRSTIGVDFALKVLNWNSNTIIRLQLWDIAGQERFGNMTRVYYKEAAGAFIVFDVSRPQTFESVLKWKADLDSKLQLIDGKPIPVLLLANKNDLEKVGPAAHSSELDEFCAANGFIGWFETSAKEDTGVVSAANYLIQNILSVQKAGRYDTPLVDTEIRKLVNGSTSRHHALLANLSKHKCCYN